MKRKILKLIEKNARMTNAEIATIIGVGEDEVRKEISELEASGVIKAYKGVINHELVDTDLVSAIIELKVTPKAELGFEDVAARISKYPEVESVLLMSGACDLVVTVSGRTFREVCAFVANELATIESVTSTATQFIMRKYKEFGVELCPEEADERGAILL
ncbi:MAG: Lrp/AsnC family transcriptional regulator [Clostridia bacterium]|jgi:DNA-binding Lrp family transcriptional regulator|nr:Lrp/AsnC family transcriptional regulator [Clostridia bacterium]